MTQLLQTVTTEQLDCLFHVGLYVETDVRCSLWRPEVADWHAQKELSLAAPAPSKRAARPIILSCACPVHVLHDAGLCTCPSIVAPAVATGCRLGLQ